MRNEFDASFSPKVHASHATKHRENNTIRAGVGGRRGLGLHGTHFWSITSFISDAEVS